MKPPLLPKLLLLAGGIMLTLGPSSWAAVVFSEDFNGYFGGNQNALQVDTSLMLSHSGNLPGWNKAGGGAVHAVDLDGAGNYAPMIWQDNVITSVNAIGINDSGATYTVDFVTGPTVYSGASQAT